MGDDDDHNVQGCKVHGGDQEPITGVHYKPLSIGRTRGENTYKSLSISRAGGENNLRPPDSISP